MPFGKSRVAGIYTKEILRVVSGAEIAENAVVEGRTIALNSDGRRILEPGTVMVYAGKDEIVDLKITATGGTWTATQDAQVTSALNWNATAAQVQAALSALSTVDDLQVEVTLLDEDLGPAVPGGSANFAAPSRTYRVRYFGTEGAIDQTAITIQTGSLTGTVVAGTATVVQNGAAAAAGAGQNVKPATGTPAAAIIAGIVRNYSEFWSEATLSDADNKPVAIYTKNCHFEASQLVGYAGNEANTKTAMSGAGTGRTANCTFE
jgi:hypothetical protein